MAINRKRSAPAVRKQSQKATSEEAGNTTKKSRVATNRATGRLKDDDDFESEDEVGDDTSVTGSISSLDLTSPSSKSNSESTSQRSGNISTLLDKTKQADLQKENKALKTQIQKQTRMAKLKKASNDEDELVTIKLRRYVKEQLWKKVKFITDDTVLQKAMNACAKHFGVDDKEKPDWKLRHAKEVQFSINNRRNNCAQDLEKAYMSKYTTRVA